MVYILTFVVGFYTVSCSSSKNLEQQNEGELTEQTDSVATDTTELLTEKEKAAEKERREKLEDKYKEELNEEYQGQANGITTFYAAAQRLFYMGKFQNALYHIDKAAEIKETADILALRGSIYLGLGDTDKFVEQWNQALQMDENVPIPNVPHLIRQLKAQGLISENYNPEN